MMVEKACYKIKIACKDKWEIATSNAKYNGLSSFLDAQKSVRKISLYKTDVLEET